MTKYIYILGVTITLYYCIVVNSLRMSEENQINSLQNKPDKYYGISTGQYMESKIESKLDLIGIDNTSHFRYIVAVNAYMFHVTMWKQ